MMASLIIAASLATALGQVQGRGAELALDLLDRQLRHPQLLAAGENEELGLGKAFQHVLVEGGDGVPVHGEEAGVDVVGRGAAGQQLGHRDEIGLDQPAHHGGRAAAHVVIDAAARDHVRLAGLERRQQLRNPFQGMLAVGVDPDHRLVVVPEEVVEGDLGAGAKPQIVGQAEAQAVEILECGPLSGIGAVVEHQHRESVGQPFHGDHDPVQQFGVVEGGDEDQNLGRRS
jgi:hypothetical protein